MPGGLNFVKNGGADGNPALSVILVTPGGLPPIRRTLLTLQQQTAANCLELVIIGPGQPPASTDFDSSRFQAVRWVPWQLAPLDLHRARAIGVAVSRSPMVTFAENHAFPRPGWAAALINAQRQGWDAVGPVMKNANPASAVSRAHLLLAHGAWTHPQRSGPRAALPWHNSAYKTAGLLSFKDRLPRHLASEGVLQAELRRQGARFYLMADAVVDHLNISRLQPFLAEQVLAGRLYGTVRSKQWSPIRRIGYIMAAGLIPGLRLLRIKKNFPGVSVSLVPLIAAGVVAHTIGETLGYLLSEGNTVRQSGVYELARENFIRFTDRKGLDTRFPGGRLPQGGVGKDSMKGTCRKRLFLFPDHCKERLKQMMARAPLPLPPLRLQIDVTDNCNFSCPGCLKWRAQNCLHEMSTAQYQRLWPRLKHLILFREVTFSGGEPLLREDLPDLIAGAAQAGFHTTVATNGWFLNGTLFKRLVHVGLNCILLSLNSLETALHDSSKGMPGSYQRVRSVVRLWEKARLRPELVIGTVVTPANVQELPALVEYVEKRNLSVLFQIFCGPEAHYPFADHASIPDSKVPRDSAVWSPDALADLDWAVHRLIRMKTNGAPIRNSVFQLQRFPGHCCRLPAEQAAPCSGTHYRLFIDPVGQLRLCQGTAPIGNILVDSPARLWWGPAARQIRRSSRTCRSACRMLNNHW